MPPPSVRMPGRSTCSGENQSCGRPKSMKKYASTRMNGHVIVGSEATTSVTLVTTSRPGRRGPATASGPRYRRRGHGGALGASAPPGRIVTFARFAALAERGRHVEAGVRYVLMTPRLASGARRPQACHPVGALAAIERQEIHGRDEHRQADRNFERERRQVRGSPVARDGKQRQAERHDRQDGTEIRGHHVVAEGHLERPRGHDRQHQRLADEHRDAHADGDARPRRTCRASTGAERDADDAGCQIDGRDEAMLADSEQNVACRRL